MPPRRHTVAALAAGLLAAALAGCAGDGPAATSPSHTGPEVLGHVHGLGTDPADGALYAATHFGVFHLGPGGAGPAERVADRWQDTMAFTVVGPQHFLASGHPDPTEDSPPHLGLIESTDAARTWEPVSLHGRADFHALEVAGRLLYGYDAVTGRLMVSTDHRTWEVIDRARVADLAADPEDPSRVLASTPDGVVAYRARGGAGSVVRAAPPLLLLDWPSGDLLVGLTGDGEVFRSSDRGDSWHRAEGPPGDPQALDVTPGSWYVATSAGLFRSTDDGRTWQPLSTQ